MASEGIYCKVFRISKNNFLIIFLFNKTKHNYKSSNLCDTEVCKKKGVVIFWEVICPFSLIVTSGCKPSPDSAPLTQKPERLSSISNFTSSGFSWVKVDDRDDFRHSTLSERIRDDRNFLNPSAVSLMCQSYGIDDPLIDLDSYLDSKQAKLVAEIESVAKKDKVDHWIDRIKSSMETGLSESDSDNTTDSGETRSRHKKRRRHDVDKHHKKSKKESKHHKKSSKHRSDRSK